MSRAYAVSLSSVASRQVQRERAWLHNHRGPQRADAFEAELRHAMELLGTCPEMGNPVEDEGERHWFLRRSRFHVYYVVDHERRAVVLAHLRHEKQRP